MAEAVLRISHALIVPRKVALGEIRRVLSHPLALLQCEQFFQKNPGLTKIESRPVRGSRFEYLFYLDVVAAPGRREDLDGAVEEFARCSTHLRRLGTYPTAETFALSG